MGERPQFDGRAHFFGAAGRACRPECLYTGVDSVVLAMDSFAFWPATSS